MNKICIFKNIILNIAFILLLTFHNGLAQTSKGKLFIIGGGNRSDQLMNKLLQVAALKQKDYIVVLPMSSAEPDSAYFYFKKQVEKLTKHQIVMLNFDQTKTSSQVWIDSLQKAQLIFITGGDQSRFMNIVAKTPVYGAIHKAFKNGSTIAGTSAGAAVMSQHMITGNQKLNSKYAETFNSIQFDNIETSAGLGLIKNVIIDQHFLKRSRYNRLISALIEFPNHIGIGIDESTAILVANKTIEVIGESEIIVLKNPKKIVKSKTNNLVSVQNISMRVMIAGEKFNF
jgi:cyanophycinase